MILYKKKNIGTISRKITIGQFINVDQKKVADPKLVLRVLLIGQVLRLIPRLHADT